MATPVVVMGLGDIGRAVARAALAEPELEIAGAVDLSPERVGQPLSVVLQAAAPEVKVTNIADDAFRAAKGGILLHATGSRLEKVAGEVEGALRAGLSVVSTCEELAFPWVRNPRIADRLDRLAEKRGVTVLGTGANPGFVFDRLVATLGQVVGRIERVRAVRVVDAAQCREALQRRVGAGMAERDFHRGVEEGLVGRVGLLESAYLAASGLGHSVDEVDEDIFPVVAETPQRTPWGVVQPGEICGVRQVARAFDEGREIVLLELTMAFGANNPRDEINIVGDPPLSLVIPGGTPEEKGTAWSVVHAALVLGEGAEPGLITVLDLPAGR